MKLRSQEQCTFILTSNLLILLFLAMFKWCLQSVHSFFISYDYVKFTASVFNRRVEMRVNHELKPVCCPESDGGLHVSHEPALPLHTAAPHSEDDAAPLWRQLTETVALLQLHIRVSAAFQVRGHVVGLPGAQVNSWPGGLVCPSLGEQGRPHPADLRTIHTESVYQENAAECISCYSGKCCSFTFEIWCTGDINKVYFQIFVAGGR